MTKSEKRAAALKFGVRWREQALEAKARRATLKLRAAEAGVRTAGRFEEPISPDREQKTLEFSPYKLPPLSKRAPPVSPEKLDEFRLYKGVNDVEAWKEDTQRSSISRESHDYCCQVGCVSCQHCSNNLADRASQVGDHAEQLAQGVGGVPRLV